MAKKTEQQQYDALKEKRQGEFKRQQYAADMDAQDAALKGRRDQQFRQKKVASGDYPSYMAEEGDMIPSPDGGDSFVSKGPEISQSPNPNPVQMPEQDDSFSIQGLDKDSNREYRREQKKQNTERVNAMLTQRARERRGLPPLENEAPTQPAADAGGLMKAVDVRDLQGNPIDPSQMPAQFGGPNDAVQRLPILTDPNQPDTGGGIQQLPIQTGPNQPQTGGGIEQLGSMETGSTFNFDKPLASGQTSTTVYELPGGMALPDAQNMSGQDFRQAVQQMNPGKGMMDMVRGLATEPGPAGNYARLVLRNA